MRYAPKAGHLTHARGVNQSYAQPKARSGPKLDVGAETCPSCDAPPRSPCVATGEPGRTTKKKGEVLDAYHDTRRRLATRTRNRRIEAGEEEVQGDGVVIQPLADRGNGVGTCPECGHGVPLNKDGRLMRHATDGGKTSITLNRFQCVGSGVME